MPYLIDGHNLIPNVGLHLDSPDDEMELIAILQEFSRQTRRVVEVYFDGAPAGRAGTTRFGMITAHFVEIGTTADNAIVDRLHRMGHSARNARVVSSDRQVQSAARSAHAAVESSEEFAGRLRIILVSGGQPQKGPAPKDTERLSEKDIDFWLNLFRTRS